MYTIIKRSILILKQLGRHHNSNSTLLRDRVKFLRHRTSVCMKMARAIYFSVKFYYTLSALTSATGIQKWNKRHWVSANATTIIVCLSVYPGNARVRVKSFIHFVRAVTGRRICLVQGVLKQQNGRIEKLV